MKKLLFKVVAALFAVGIVIVVVIKPILTSFATKELKHIFKATGVSIGHSRIHWGYVEFSEVSIRISKYYALNAGEVDVYFRGLVVKELNGTIEVNGKDMGIEHGFLDLADLHKPGRLTIAAVHYDKAAVTAVAANIKVEDKDIFLDPLSAQVLEGTVHSKMHLFLGDAPRFLVQFDCAQISLGRIVHDYQLKEKVALTGAISGKISLSGQVTRNGVKLDMLNGDLSSMGQGGTVTINDPQILQNLAQRIHQPQDIVVESFKDYHYNMAIVTLFLDRDGSLNVGLAMDGEKGKRDVQIVVHDFGAKNKRRW